MKIDTKITKLVIILFLSFSINLLAQKTPKPVVFYLQNLPQERIGTETDATIIDSLQKQNFWVIPVDCSTFPRTSPELEDQLVAFHKSTPTLLATYATATEEADLDNIYYVPEGYILKPNIPIWNILDHGVDGLINRIMDTWNKEIVETFGVPPVTSPEQMYDKHGNPIDYNMYMDLIYPSGTDAKDVPLVINFSSNSPRQKPFNPTGTNEVVYRNMFPFGFLTTGYAWANVDHCYNPLARTEVWEYFDRYTLEDWAGLALVRAYVRYINSHLDNYNLNGKIGTMGISKASYSSVRIANTKNAEGREHFLYGGVENTKPQPWPGVPSTIDVAYAAAGNGTRRVNTYVDKFTVPMATSAGSKDQYNQWDVYPEVVKRFNELDNNHLALWMEDLGHTYPGLGTDLATGENRYKLLKTYFDSFLKATPAEPLKIFYIYPKENASEVDTKGLTRILIHDGILPTAMLGLSPYAPITVRFLTAVDSVAFVQNVKIYHKLSNTEITGSWKVKTGNTTFEFTPENALVKDEIYKIVVAANLENIHGQKMNAETTREFTVTKEGEAEVETQSVLIYPTDDTYQKTSLGTTAYGAQNTMRVRYSPYGDWRFDGYIKFNISECDVSKIKSAKIKLSSSTTLTGDPVSLTIYKTATNWTESTLLSTSRPSIVGDGLDVVNFTGTELWTYFDVTNQLKSDLNEAQEVISFMIRAATGGSTENVYFNTKEVTNETLKPVLVVEEIVPTTGLTPQPIPELQVYVADKTLYYKGDDKLLIRIYDMSGRSFLTKLLNGAQTVDLKAITSGIYAMTLQSENSFKSIKIRL
ncbi:MAG: DNRLRE domain-containing protein [Paludibacter sp.]|nr:DNRLRE domain-containing protein [Paludibacter sp.]